MRLEGHQGLHRSRLSAINNIAIETIDLWKIYGGAVKTEALRGVNLEIANGDFVCVTGPSGHGKSTLLHMIGGLDRPTSGNVFIEGTDITGINSAELADMRSKRIGFVFQFFNLIPNLTAKENVQLALMFGSLPKRQHQDRAIELLSLLGLRDKSSSRPNELSGGQQQRVAIARALANKPDILLMDEPTGNLDSKSESDLLNYVQEINQQGKTIVIVSHSDRIVEKARRVIRLEDGRIR